MNAETDGAGPGGVTLIGLGRTDDIGPRTEKILADAALIAGPPRWLDALGRFPAEKLPLAGSLGGWLQEIEKRSQTAPAAVLASGDPNFFGLAKRLLEAVPRGRVTIIPAPTTVQRAFARLKISWAGVPVVSLHGRGFSREFFPALFRAGLAGSPGYLAVYTDPVNTPALIASKILERGLDGWKMIVCEDLDTDSEKVTALTLAEAAERAFSDLNLTILGREALFTPIRIGAPEMDFVHEEGMITKSEVRAAALSKLSLTGSETMWDIGCGSGAVSVEAAGLLPFGEVFALEKNPERFRQARRNVSLYGAANVSVILGDANELLDALPRPGRIFLGGGGADLTGLIRRSRKALEQGGVIVASVVSLESLSQAVAALGGDAGPPDVTQVQISRSHSLAGSYYFRPLNPVFLVRGEF
jgi:precorrin-6Y C5,15-methyltransferase (decarboxylating)